MFSIHEVTFYTNIRSEIVIAQNDDNDDDVKDPKKGKIAFFRRLIIPLICCCFSSYFLSSPGDTSRQQKEEKIPLELFQLAAYEPMKSACCIHILFMPPVRSRPPLASTHDSVLRTEKKSFLVSRFYFH